MKKRLFFSLFLILIGCTDPVQEGTIAIQVVPQQLTDTLLYSNLYNHYEITPLESTDNVVVAEVSNLIKHNNHYFICDKISNTVFMFDLDGKFVRKIGRQGRGPGEFQSIANIAVDHSDQTFVILCSHPHKMIRFTVDGKYIEEIQLEIFASSIVFDNDRIYLYTNSNKTKKDTDYQLYTTNIKGKIKDSFLPFGSIKQYPHPVIINNSQAFVKNHDEILFYMPLEETIFSLRNNKLTEKYKLDFGENSIPYSYIDKNSTNPDFMFQLSSEKYAMNLHHVFETNQHLFFNITINQLLYRLAYHKTAHTLHHFRDDVTELHPVLFSLTQQEMLGAKTAMAIIIENRYKTLKNQKTKFEALASSLQETSNPVIVRYWNE